MGIDMTAILDALFLKAQAYIQYEEKEAANMARDSRHEKNLKGARQEKGSR